MIRLIALLVMAIGYALLNGPPSARTQWTEGAPEAWARLDLSAFENPADGFMCPMDRDVVSKTQGYCPRCRMKLMKVETSARADSPEYPVVASSEPAALQAGAPAALRFRVENPETHTAVNDFELVHEKFYHLFLVSEDLSFFLHTHPEPQPDASLRLRVTLPKTGMYRVLSDFYPKGGTPQLVSNTLFVGNNSAAQTTPHLSEDLSVQRAENLTASLTAEPARPVAHAKTQLYLRWEPNDGMEPYLGAMGHMLVASADLVDMMHSHPLQTTDGYKYKQLQFQVMFPRAGMYRVWIQSQRKGVVNTVAFNIAVAE